MLNSTELESQPLDSENNPTTIKHVKKEERWFIGGGVDNKDTKQIITYLFCVCFLKQVPVAVSPRRQSSPLRPMTEPKSGDFRSL